MAQDFSNSNDRIEQRVRRFKLLAFVLLISVALAAKFYYDIITQSGPLEPAKVTLSDVEAQALGDEYYLQQRYPEALPYYLQAVKAAPDNTDYLRRLGSIYSHVNRFHLAESVLNKAQGLDVQQQQYSLNVAENHFYFSRLYRRQNEYDSAGSAIKQAIEVAKKANLSKNYWVKYQTDLAVNLMWRGHHDQAEQLIDEIFTYVGAAKAENAAALYATRGLLNRRLGRNELALKDLDKALQMYIATFGVEHSRVARQRSNLGAVYRQLEQYGKALTQYKTALQSLIKIYGHHHQSVSILYINIANILIIQGKHSEAQAHLEKALQVNKNIGVGVDRVQMFTLITLGEVNLERRQLEEAEEYFQQAEVICFELFGEAHHNMAYIWSLMGDVNLKKEMPDNARMFYQKAREIYLKSYGPQHNSSKEIANKLSRLTQLK